VIEPLCLSYAVACPPAHAFRTWTERIGAWWPRSHTTSGDPAAEVVLEPGVGGRIFERLADGTEVDWGEVTAWEPPDRLAYLWHIRRDRADATDVAIAFVDAGDGTTRVEVTHTGWERLGADGPTWRDANAGGWDGLVPHFAAAAETTRHEGDTTTTWTT
jgi:hypothetical protein